ALEPALQLGVADVGGLLGDRGAHAVDDRAAVAGRARRELGEQAGGALAGGPLVALLVEALALFLGDHRGLAVGGRRPDAQVGQADQAGVAALVGAAVAALGAEHGGIARA